MAKKTPRKRAVPKAKVSTAQQRRTAEKAAAKTPQRLSELKADPKNARRIGDAAARGLRYSMDSFGDLSGIVFNLRSKELVAGHQRLAQLRAKYDDDLVIERLDAERGIICEPDGTTWQVRFVDWPASQQRAANIAANSTKISGEFTDDLQLLLEETKEETPELFDGLLFSRLQPAELPDDGTLEEKYQVIIDCEDEADQRQLYERLVQEGRKCQVLTA